MFGKKKHEPPMNKLREIYNDLANSSLSNLSLEQNGHLKEALVGWKNLHFHAESKLEKLNDDISDQLLTEEESFLFDEIHILKAQADDNMMRLNRSLEQTARRKKQQLLAKQQNALNSASPSPIIPTLRSNIPTTMNSKKNSAKPMMKSLRSGGGGNSNNYNNANGSSSNITNNITNSSTSSVSSTSAKHAANMIWSPSTSLTTGKSSNAYNDEQFTDFATDYGEYYQQETLKQLQHQGQSSKNYRGTSPTSPYDSQDDSDFTDQFQSSLKISKQQQLMNRKPSPSDRAKAALKASAAVKYPSRPTQRSANKNKSPVRQTKSSTQKKSKSNNRKESPSRVPILSDSQKDTETLDNDSTTDEDISDDEKLIRSLKGVDPTAAKQILNEIVVKGDEVHWDDIAGLETAKKSLKETVVYPFLRPDLFRGLREPASGMLLFGPPGTGKTMLARAVATESESTFFSIQASSLTSKYLGESEKLVRALFQVAKARAPSIIFVDEIDSLLGTRSNEGENESSRRIKNEFLVQWSDLTKAAAGRDSGEEMQRVLVLAATNLPWGIDEAARRRFVRRQYIPLPEAETRKAQFIKLLSHQIHTLTETQLDELIDLSEGFSGSDITALAKDAAMGPLRELGDKLLSTNKSEIRPLGLIDFIGSLKYIRPSVSQNSLKQFEDWAKNYGSSGV